MLSNTMSFLSDFRLIRLRFHYAAARPPELPGYLGSALHGGLGASIKRISPSLYPLLFDPARSGKSVPKPFVLWSPESRDDSSASGFNLVVETVLFGTALDHASIYLCAFDDMAGAGLAGRNNRFVLRQIEALAPNGDTHRIYDRADNYWGNLNRAVFSASAWIDARPGLEKYSRLMFQFPTLLRLQDGNHLLSTQPGFNTLFSRLLGRINSLACFYAGIPALLPDEKNGLLEAASCVEMLTSEMQWQDWDRYSSRQKAWMKFGGLQGSIVYQGEFKAFMPYLLLGELIHVGAKTSFGLGKYIVLPAPSPV